MEPYEATRQGYDRRTLTLRVLARSLGLGGAGGFAIGATVGVALSGASEFTPLGFVAGAMIGLVAGLVAQTLNTALVILPLVHRRPSPTPTGHTWKHGTGLRVVALPTLLAAAAPIGLFSTGIDRSTVLAAVLASVATAAVGASTWRWVLAPAVPQT